MHKVFIGLNSETYWNRIFWAIKNKSTALLREVPTKFFKFGGIRGTLVYKYSVPRYIYIINDTWCNQFFIGLLSVMNSLVNVSPLTSVRRCGHPPPYATECNIMSGFLVLVCDGLQLYHSAGGTSLPPPVLLCCNVLALYTEATDFWNYCIFARPERWVTGLWTHFYGSGSKPNIYGGRSLKVLTLEINMSIFASLYEIHNQWDIKTLPEQTENWSLNAGQPWCLLKNLGSIYIFFIKQ